MQRQLGKYIIDLFLWILITPIAIWIRIGESWFDYSREIVALIALGLPVKSLLIYVLAFHQRSWHKLGIRDLFALMFGVGISATIFLFITLYPTSVLNIPRSVPIIEAMLAILALSGVRLSARLLYERKGILNSKNEYETRRVLIVGAGEAGTMMAREMIRHPEANCIPVGFLDDDPWKRRQRYVGLRVFGIISDLPEVVKKERIDEVLIAMPSEPGSVVRRIVELARQAPVRYKIIPGIYELLSEEVTLSHIRDVNLEDLLRRDVVRLETEQIVEYLCGKTVLVTGAGGSIGSEIVRQVARFAPLEIVLVGRGENSIFEIDREIIHLFPDVSYRVVITDVRDRDGLEHVFRRFQPQVVFHAAAHKHVPLMEANPEQAIFNNVGGTKNLVELALEYAVERFVNISTDKAINPTSIMGASKRVAEMVVHEASKQCTQEQTFVSVRFGNVLGSRGSVIPLFIKQILQGGPITVTDPEMRRYFMTIPEASQLVLQAGSMAENGHVYVLDMGEPVRIVDLANDLIVLSGLEPGLDIDIVYTGIRSGEKLFEELLSAEEGTEPSPHEKIFVARNNNIDEKGLEILLDQLFAAAYARDTNRIREVLIELIPTNQFNQVTDKVSLEIDK